MTCDRAGLDAALESATPGRPSQVLTPGLGVVAGASASGDTMPADMVADKASAENFPVALRFLPATYRDHLMAVYVFARTVDDVGDLAPPDQRGRLLTELEEDVKRLYGGVPTHPAVIGLADVVADCGIGIQPFLDLIRANQQDQIVSRYETFDDLLGYCTLSANPVGRIVLQVFGCYTPQRERLSDDVCSALQLAEHWQDVAEDFRAGRIYIPAVDMRRYGCSEQDLAGSVTPPQLRRLMAFEVERARALLNKGAALVGTLRGAPRVAIAGYVAGGRAALAAIAAADFDVLTSTPRPRKARLVAELGRTYVRGR